MPVVVAVEQKFLSFLTVVVPQIEYFVGNQNEWKLSFRGQKLVLGKFQGKDECFFRLINSLPCAGYKKHEFVLQFQVLPNYQYLKVEDTVSDLHFYQNERKWNRILIKGENVCKLDKCFIENINQPNKRAQNALKTSKNATSISSTDEIIPSANLTFPPGKQQIKSLCACLIFSHYYLKQLSLKFLGNEPTFSITNISYLKFFVVLRELQVTAQNYFHQKSFIEFLTAIKCIKSLETLKLEGKHDNLDALFINFPLQIKRLLLKKFQTKIPPSIENVRNLEELTLDSVNGKLKSEIFTLPNFQKLTLLKPQFIRYLPAIARNCIITNIRFLAYYIPPIKITKAKCLPTLFDLCASQIFSHNQLFTFNINPPNTVSLFINRIWKCDLDLFSINDQLLTLNEFKILSLNLKEIIGINRCVKNPDDSILPFEEILSYVPNVYHFLWGDDLDNAETSFTTETAQKMAKLDHRAKLRCCSLRGVPRNFDPVSFASFIKINSATN